MHLEAIDARLVTAGALLGVESRVHLEQNGVEGGTKIGTVDGGVAGGFRVVNVFTLRAVQLDSALVGDVGLAHGQQSMAIAHHTRTLAKVALLVLLKLVDVSIQFRPNPAVVHVPF
jgi:hypothetical protein